MDSPICKKKNCVCKLWNSFRIIFLNVKIVKTLSISASPVYNISVCEGQALNQYWMPLIVGSSGSTALKQEQENSTKQMRTKHVNMIQKVCCFLRAETHWKWAGSRKTVLWSDQSGFRSTYASIQMTYFLVKAFYISEKTMLNCIL